jgi:hypothetical protein
MSSPHEEIPDVPSILAGVLRGIDPAQQPVLLAKLERLAAERYKRWANDHPVESVRKGLLECADREETVAERIESLFPNAATIQNNLLAENPSLLELNRTLFEGRSLDVQFAMQAAGERAGAAAWQAYAAGTSDCDAQRIIASCSALEQANADFLQTLL